MSQFINRILSVLLQIMKIEKKNLLKSVHFKKTVHDPHFFKIVVVFNTTLADIKTKSADVVLKLPQF